MKWGNRHHYTIHASGIACILVLFSLRVFPGRWSSFGYKQIWQASSPFQEYCRTFTESHIKEDTIKKAARSNLPGAKTGNKSNQGLDTYNPFVPLKIELNTADSAELVKLYGIGPYYAVKILEYRDKLGGFAVPEQLLEVYGMDRERLKGFYDDVFADTTFIRKMDLKTVTEDQLASHIYIGRYLARCIIRYRETTNPDSCTVTNLLRDSIFTKEQAAKIGWYLY